MHNSKWIALVFLVVVLIVGYAFLPIGNTPSGKAANATTVGSIDASPGQLAAIQGAQQLLLLQPMISRVYLPLTVR